jgi:hypothetical protein
MSDQPSSTASVSTALSVKSALSAVSKSSPFSSSPAAHALIRGRQIAES